MCPGSLNPAPLYGWRRRPKEHECALVANHCRTPDPEPALANDSVNPDKFIERMGQRIDAPQGSIMTSPRLTSSSKPRCTQGRVANGSKSLDPRRVRRLRSDASNSRTRSRRAGARQRELRCERRPRRAKSRTRHRARAARPSPDETEPRSRFATPAVEFPAGEWVTSLCSECLIRFSLGFQRNGPSPAAARLASPGAGNSR